MAVVAKPNSTVIHDQPSSTKIPPCSLYKLNFAALLGVLPFTKLISMKLKNEKHAIVYCEFENPCKHVEKPSVVSLALLGHKHFFLPKNDPHLPGLRTARSWQAAPKYHLRGILKHGLRESDWLESQPMG